MVRGDLRSDNSAFPLYNEVVLFDEKGAAVYAWYQIADWLARL